MVRCWDACRWVAEDVGLRILILVKGCGLRNVTHEEKFYSAACNVSILVRGCKVT